MCLRPFRSPTTAVGGRLRHSNAGHPPPSSSTTTATSAFSATVMACCSAWSQATATTTSNCPPRSTLLLYTNGLVERPGKSLEDGIELLRPAHCGPGRRTPRRLLRRAARRPPGGSDDIAVLAVRVTPTLRYPARLRRPRRSPPAPVRPRRSAACESRCSVPYV
ncbi:SpoIIE family protein phosphatase [Streptomyces sp. NPDC006602]|uniref:SpoIIE family protein phosphatase n=1 Tax=Streptomyces sp. NPDC006602 TaxID=3364751 RepID=UPI0036A5E023